MKKLMLLTAWVALAAWLTVGAGQNGTEQDNRIRLLFATVETSDTRIDEMQKPVIMPDFKPTYSDAELQRLSGRALEEATRRNLNDIAANNAAKFQLALREYERRVKVQEEIVTKAKTMQVGRNFTLARDWFIGAMGRYDDLFLLISRTDDQEAQTEKFYADTAPLAVESSTFFLKLILSDPSQHTESIPTAGGNTLTKTTTGQLITVQVQNLKNEVVFTKNVEVSDVSSGSSVVRTTGDSDVLGKVLRKGCDKVADEVASAFTDELTVSVKGPKGDGDFDADNVTLILDGRLVAHDKPIHTIRAKYMTNGKHLLKAKLDGYETVEKAITASAVVTMKKAATKEAK